MKIDRIRIYGGIQREDNAVEDSKSRIAREWNGINPR